MNRFPPQGGVSKDDLRTATGRYKILNRFRTPDFSSTTDFSTVNCNISLVDGVFKITGNDSRENFRIEQLNICDLVVGHKYLIRVKQRMDNSVAEFTRVTAYGTPTVGKAVVIGRVENPVAGIEYTLEGEFVCTDQASKLSLQLSTTYATAEIANGKSVIYTYAEVIDISEDFGVGKEPPTNLLIKMINQQLGGKVLNSGYVNLNIVALQNGLYGGKVVCFGDSMTEGDVYPETIAEVAGMTAYNVGFGGCRMAFHESANYDKFSMAKLVDAISTNVWTDQDAAVATITGFAEELNRLKAIDFTAVDYITIFYGTNDFASEVPLGTNSDVDRTTFKGAINYIIDKIATAFPNLKILFLTPTYRARISPNDGLDTDVTPNDITLYLKDYVDAIIEVANLNHVPVLDLWRNSGINKHNHATLLLDGLHPTSACSARLGRQIASSLLVNQ